jgi:hypothetical protein
MATTEFRRTKAAPGLMIYPVDVLSSRRHQTMNAEERGIFTSIRDECWVNGSVPTNHAQLAKILRLELDEVKRGLTEKVLYYLDEANGEFTMPDVERYRAELTTKREKQSQGGKKGMKTRWAESAELSDNSVNKELTNQHNKVGITPRDRVRGRDESETESTGSVVNDEFVEQIEAYERASNGL